MKLKDIAEILIGLPTNRLPIVNNDKEEGYTYSVISLKSIDSMGSISVGECEKVLLREEVLERFLTKEGDVLIRLSKPHTAIYIDKQSKGLLVTANFGILRMTTEDVLPEYVVGYLNNAADVKKLIQSLSQGSNLQALKSSDIQSISIRSLPKERQAHIANLFSMSNERKQLLHQLATLQEKQYISMMQKLLQQ